MTTHVWKYVDPDGGGSELLGVVERDGPCFYAYDENDALLGWFSSEEEAVEFVRRGVRSVTDR